METLVKYWEDRKPRDLDAIACDLEEVIASIGGVEFTENHTLFSILYWCFPVTEGTTYFGHSVTREDGQTVIHEGCSETYDEFCDRLQTRLVDWIEAQGVWYWPKQARRGLLALIYRLSWVELAAVCWRLANPIQSTVSYEIEPKQPK